MQSQNKFFEDLSKALNGAAGSFAGMAREAQDAARERAREFIGGTDFVSREEFETLKDRLALVESALAAQGGATPASAPKKKPKA
ncbi:MAG: accessory factor UbiK family protein [Sphingopyxis sp.]